MTTEMTAGPRARPTILAPDGCTYSYSTNERKEHYDKCNNAHDG